MEANRRWAAITAVAPIAWGTNYYVTRHLLPDGFPLYGAVLRALPAGLLLLALHPVRPRGSWWWRFAVLGVLNVGAFFTLIYVAAQLLPTSVASSVMAASPILMMLLAWGLAAERPAPLHLLGGAVGLMGVVLMVSGGHGEVRLGGLLASVAAMTSSSLGYILAKRWRSGLGLTAATAWQLLFGSALLLPVAIAVEGTPPRLDAWAVVGFGYVSVVATAVAFVCWFAGLAHLPAGTVGLVGLLNPLTGVVLGTGLAGERLSPRALAGMALVLLAVVFGQRVTARRAALPLDSVLPEIGRSV
jgi:probable blue pigment (indigoidine) exporter